MSASQLQLIERAPIRFASRILVRGFQPGCFTDATSFAVAMRVRRQIEQDIFAQIRREIDEFRSG